MPVEGPSDNAIHEVLQNLGKHSEKSKEIKQVDMVFLKALMNSPVVHSLQKAHATLENTPLNSWSYNTCDVVKQVIHDFEGVDNKAANELSMILKSPHILSVLATHDTVAEQNTVPQQYISEPVAHLQEYSEESDFKDWQCAVRMIGLSKPAGESLGLTVSVVDDDIVVSRILHGGLIHKQGLMHVGDIIREVNGQNVKGNPELLKRCFQNKATQSYTFKIIPSYKEPVSAGDVFMKCNFAFNPADDAYIPSKEAGLSFDVNQVLKIVNRDDKQWWQAQYVNEKGEAYGRAGLIPSLELQERRRIFTNQHSLNNRKSVCKMYKLSDYYNEFADDFFLYEEVALLPPFTRKFVALCSHDSSVAYQVRIKLVEMYPDLYKSPITHTSCETNNVQYNVTSKERMMEDLKDNKYFEFVESKNEVFGTKYESVRNVMKSGKTCIKDVSIKNLKFLMTSEFMPYVIFLKPESDIVECSAHCISLLVPHHDVVTSANNIHNNLKKLSKQHQWVPVSWLY